MHFSSRGCASHMYVQCCTVRQCTILYCTNCGEMKWDITFFDVMKRALRREKSQTITYLRTEKIYYTTHIYFSKNVMSKKMRSSCTVMV